VAPVLPAALGQGTPAWPATLEGVFAIPPDIATHAALQRQQARALSARAGAQALDRERWPVLELNAAVRHSRVPSGGFTAQPSREVGAQLRMPIDLGGLQSGRRAEASARLAREELLLQEAQRQARAAQELAQQTYWHNKARAGVLEQAQVLAQQAVQASERSYLVNQRRSMDVLLAGQRLYELQRQWAQAQAQMLWAAGTAMVQSGAFGSVPSTRLDALLLTPAPGAARE
jgi:outer membrane protein TolC